jgi:hypothetical protein
VDTLPPTANLPIHASYPVSGNIVLLPRINRIIPWDNTMGYYYGQRLRTASIAFNEIPMWRLQSADLINWLSDSPL